MPAMSLGSRFVQPIVCMFPGLIVEREKGGKGNENKSRIYKSSLHKVLNSVLMAI